MSGFLSLAGQILGISNSRNKSTSDNPLEAVKEYDRKKSKEDAAFQMYKRGEQSKDIIFNGLMDLSTKRINAATENGKKINI